MKLTPQSPLSDFTNYIEENTQRIDISYRGGGVEIDVTELFPRISEERGGQQLLSSAYQNYLGGGMTGCILSNCNFYKSKLTDEEQELRNKVHEALERYFYNVQNDNDLYADEWSKPGSFEAQQSRPASAY